MITGFSIILDEEILYVSNENKYSFFEIVIFIEKLIKSLNPKNYWRLTNIFFDGENGQEQMIIKHSITDTGQNIFYCITGDFFSGSEEANKMLEEYCEKVNTNYATTESIKKASKTSEFEKVIKLITVYLWKKYRVQLEDEEFSYSCLNNNNKIIYFGLSTQGLPIISKLYDKAILESFEREFSQENIELFTSNLSAKLATINMNTQIRAKSKIKEILFDDLEEQECKKFILYGNINGFSLDLIASGDIFKIKEVFKTLENKIASEKVLLHEFNGELKPYRKLSSYLDEIIYEFDQ